MQSVGDEVAPELQRSSRPGFHLMLGAFEDDGAADVGGAFVHEEFDGGVVADGGAGRGDEGGGGD